MGWNDSCLLTFAVSVGFTGVWGSSPQELFATNYIHDILQQPTFCLCKKQSVNMGFETFFG